ncbi:MAG: response regulator transcription factor [Thiotrichales bacterium]
MNTSAVYLVDDDAAVRDALLMLFETEGMEARAFADARQFLDAFEPGWTGCLLLDLRMPGMSGIELQTELSRRGCQLRIIFLTAFGDIPTTVQAIKRGAIDFLTKPINSQLLLRRVKEALGECTTTEASRRVHLDILTTRENEILQHIVIGMTNKEIARVLGISHRTVEVHRSHILQKTGCSNSLELAHLVHTRGGGERPHSPEK